MVNRVSSYFTKRGNSVTETELNINRCKLPSRSKSMTVVVRYVEALKIDCCISFGSPFVLFSPPILFFPIDSKNVRFTEVTVLVITLWERFAYPCNK